MFADMVGYTALMQEDEGEARRQTRGHREILGPAVERHDGEILQHYGDGTLSIFRSAVEAVECAVEIQLAVAERGLVPLRIGVHAGDVVRDGEDVYGDGVNVASRIEGLAAAGGVLVSGKVFEEIKNHPAISVTAMGSARLKNVADPVALYAISNDGLQVPEGLGPAVAGVPPQGPGGGGRPRPARRYSDEERRELLDRAARLEREGHVPAGSARDPTLPELEEVAAEAGMNPLAVREAARGMDLESQGSFLPTSSSRGILGAPLTLHLERTVPGRVPEEALDALIPLLRRGLGGVGEPERVGSSIRWESRNDTATRVVYARVSGGGAQTRIVLEDRCENMAWVVYSLVMGVLGGGIGLGVGFGVGFGAGLSALGTAAFATIVPLIAFTLSFLLSRGLYAGYVRGRSGALERLMDELEEMLTDLE